MNLTPLQALRALIITRTLEMVEAAPHDFSKITDGDEVDELWEALQEDYPDTMTDAANEVRGSGRSTGLAVPVSRNYDPEAVAVLTPFGRWVGFTYWAGGGKHGNPEEIEWQEDAYWVDAEIDQTLRLDYKFTATGTMPEPFDETTISDFHARLAAMNTFCAPVTTESMAGQNVFAWINTESQRLVMQMGEDAAAGVGPMSAFQKAFGTGPVSGVVASLFAAEMMATPAKNYFELVYHTPELGDFTVTIQRTEGERPTEQLAAAQKQRDELLAALKDAVKTWEEGDDDDVSGGMRRANDLIAKLAAE